MSTTDSSLATEVPERGPPGGEPAERIAGDPQVTVPAGPGVPDAEVLDAAVVSQPGTGHHWVLLIGAAVIVLLAALLELRGGERIGFPGIRTPLPGVCTFYRVTGRPCPGCGLTRSFVAIAHGDFGGAWAFNAAGPIIFLLVAGQIPYRAWRLWRTRRGVDRARGSLAAVYLAWAMVAVLMGQWILRLLPLF